MRILAAVLGTLFSLAVFAADPAQPAYLEGRDYSLLDQPVRTLNPAKIEVVEVFSYTCPHCFHFEPMIEEWAKKQKDDVALVQTHTKWSAGMEPYQRGFYTAVTLKVKDKVQLAVFKAIHEQQKQLPDAQAWADFLAAYGVSKQSVLSTYDSFIVSGQVAQADQRSRDYKITGTPEIVVEGKYRVSTRTSATYDDMLKVVQFLVDKTRAERAAAAAKH